jgi:intracellular multiplication protein IcmB
MLETQDREQRKFGIRTVLCSQYVTDFPDSVLKSANSVYVMHCRPEDKQALIDHYQVPEVTIKKFMQIPKGPAADGSGTSSPGRFPYQSRPYCPHSEKHRWPERTLGAELNAG